VESLVEQATAAAGDNPLNIDCIIPPGQATVAVLIARALPSANIISVTRDGDALPPRYMPRELLYAQGGGRIL
jgi:hypothetical protein